MTHLQPKLEKNKYLRKNYFTADKNPLDTRNTLDNILPAFQQKIIFNCECIYITGCPVITCFSIQRICKIISSHFQYYQVKSIFTEKSFFVTNEQYFLWRNVLAPSYSVVSVFHISHINLCFILTVRGRGGEREKERGLPSCICCFLDMGYVSIPFNAMLYLQPSFLGK